MIVGAMVVPVSTSLPGYANASQLMSPLGQLAELAQGRVQHECRVDPLVKLVPFFSCAF